MNPRTPHPPLSDARLDAALGAQQDGILPSSGFADSVMAAVARETAAAGAIPFPWKRAIPGLIAAAIALFLVVAALAALLRSQAALPLGAPASGANGDLALIVHNAAASVALLHNPTALWLLVSFAIPLVCLLLMRRLLFSR